MKDMPYNLNIQAEIIVNDPIPKPDNSEPFHMAVLDFEILRKAVRGFAYNLKIPRNRVHGFIVG